MQLLCRVMVASTGKRSTQDLTGVDGDVMALEGNGWVVVRTSDGSETLRVQQRYLEKRPKEHSEVAICTLHPVCVSASTRCNMWPSGRLQDFPEDDSPCAQRFISDVPSRFANVQDEALEAEGAHPQLAAQGSDEHAQAHAEEDGTPAAHMLRLPVLFNPQCAPTA